MNDGIVVEILSILDSKAKANYSVSWSMRNRLFSSIQRS